MTSASIEQQTTSAFVAIVGRPNVGKSTLLNRLLGKKLSITADKPQTTRHRILGVKTLGSAQVVYVDTPGMHVDEVHALNVEMNKAAKGALLDVDLVLLVVEGLQWTEEDSLALGSLARVNCPVILVINKVDKIKDKKVLLPYLASIQHKREFAAIFPISAEKGSQVAELEDHIARYLKPSPHYFPQDQITDKSLRFLVAERIREKLTRFLGQELPYSSTVEITEWKETETHCRISAIIWVERAGQKAIVVGKKGEGLKKMGSLARQDIEQLLSKSVYLDLWVKVKSGWSDDIRALASLGYLDPNE